MITNEIVTGKISKPSNAKIGKVLGRLENESGKPYSEATVRSWKKKGDNFFNMKMIAYHEQVSPFIPFKDIQNIKDLNISSEMIMNRIIPGIIDKEKGILLPTNLKNILETKDIITSFNESNVLSISNFKGGVGKTTTTINLATILSFYGYKVLIVDHDIQGNTTSMFDLYRYTKDNNVDLSKTKIEDIYDLKNSDFKYTLVDLMGEIENDNIESIVKEARVNLNSKTKTIGRFDIIPNTSNIENALKFEDIDKLLKTYGNTNQVLDEIISFVKNDYDFVIIDTPPSIALPLRMSVLATDYFIIALTADKMSKDGISRFLVPIEMNKKSYKRHKGKDIVVLGGVINKFQNNVVIQKTNKELINDDLINTIENSNLGESSLFEQTIKESKSLTESQNHLGSILLYEPTDELVRDYFNLADEILEKIIVDKYSKM